MQAEQASQAFALLLTGPAGAGKSTAARAWAQMQPGCVAHIPLDDIRELVVAGFADPQDGWNDATQWQYDIARQNVADMARRFVATGVACVIDDAVFPLWQNANFAGWRDLLADIPHLVVVLLPDEASVIARNTERQSHRQLAPAMLRTIYAMMAPWAEQRDFLVIDSSALSVAETAQAIERQVQRWRRAVGE